MVLSGAYAVLEGAPALVAAVDRYVFADASRPAAIVTPEVKAALGNESAPWFDASALRDGQRKLGLGSSAAILVASLAAVEISRLPALSAQELVDRVYPRALAAHTEAQGGGSGIDVAASVHGGLLCAVREAGTLRVGPVTLPRGVSVRVLALRCSSSTSALLRACRALATSNPGLYLRLIAEQSRASEAALRAARADDADAFVGSLASQTHALCALGRAAGVCIVTEVVAELARKAAAVGAAALPAGAGGGDLALWIAASGAIEPPRSDAFMPLALELGAEGVRATATSHE